MTGATTNRPLARQSRTDVSPGATGDRKISRIPRFELERRWAAVRAVMEVKGLDALMMQSRRDFHGGYVKWFTDSPAFNPRSVIFHRDDLMTIVDHGAEGGRRGLTGDHPDYPGVGEIRTTAAIPSVHFTQFADGLIAANIIADRGYTKVGWVNAAATPYGFVETVQSTAGATVRFVDATDAIDHIKAIKSATEIAEIRKACALQDAIFHDLLAELRPGLREFEVTALARYIGECHGSEQALYLASSARQGEPAIIRNRHWQGRLVDEGDYLNLLIENNAPGGYYAELARTVVFGRASTELASAFEIALAAQSHTAAQLVPGASCIDISASNDIFLESRGWSPEDRLYAHGQGYDLVERPLIRRDEIMGLAAGMYVSVHPTVRDSRTYTTVCDNFLVRGNGGAERLHQTKAQIFEI